MVSPLDSDNQKTQVLYGVENILNFTLNRFLLIKEKSDTCLDSSGPSVLVTTKPIWDSCKEFKKRGIRDRLHHRNHQSEYRLLQSINEAH